MNRAVVTGLAAAITLASVAAEPAAGDAPSPTRNVIARSTSGSGHAAGVAVVMIQLPRARGYLLAASAPDKAKVAFEYECHKLDLGDKTMAAASKNVQVEADGTVIATMRFTLTDPPAHGRSMPLRPTPFTAHLDEARCPVGAILSASAIRPDRKRVTLTLYTER